MKAIVIHHYGPPEVLQYENVPDPEPRAGEIRIRIHAATVNRVLDVSLRAGQERARPCFRSSRASVARASASGLAPESRAGDRECGSRPPASCRSIFAARMTTAMPGQPA